MTDTCRDLLDRVEPKDLTQIALQMLFTIERMELIIPEITDTIRKALEQARPTVEPVPVAERPWEREGWCDAEGQCWWFRPADFDEDDPALAWYLDGSPAPETCWEIRFYGYTHCLPHHALPTPEATNV